jgi:hypothetical protein
VLEGQEIEFSVQEAMFDSLESVLLNLEMMMFDPITMLFVLESVLSGLVTVLPNMGIVLPGPVTMPSVLRSVVAAAVITSRRKVRRSELLAEAKDLFELREGYPVDMYPATGKAIEDVAGVVEMYDLDTALLYVVCPGGSVKQSGDSIPRLEYIVGCPEDSKA